MTGHIYHRCTRQATGHCSGCYEDSGLDCMYDVLAVCKVCGGSEGSLLPTCPERWLTIEEDAANYEHYCHKTGPFEKIDDDTSGM